MKIILEKMAFYAYHGFYEQERIIGNNFEVNLILEADLTAAGKSDQLEDTLNYELIYAVVKQEMLQPSNLLEHIATRLSAAIKHNFSEVTAVTVRVTKYNPPLGGQIEKVSVEVSD